MEKVGRALSEASRHQSLEPFDLLHTHGRISARAHRAGTLLTYLRAVIHGRQRTTSHLQSIIRDRVSSDHAPDQALTIAELEERRENQEQAYNAALRVINRTGQGAVASVQNLLINDCWPDPATIHKANVALEALADHWSLTHEQEEA